MDQGPNVAHAPGGVQQSSRMGLGSVKPFGMPYSIVNQEFLPASGKKVFYPRDRIKFMLYGTNAFWNPYSAYIDVEIEFPEEMFKDPTFEKCGTHLPTLQEQERYREMVRSRLDTSVYQLDGTGQSLIQMLSIRSGNIEVERIEGHDVLAQVLYDLNMGVDGRKVNQQQGLGWQQIDTKTYIVQKKLANLYWGQDRMKVADLFKDVKFAFKNEDNQPDNFGEYTSRGLMRNKIPPEGKLYGRPVDDQWVEGQQGYYASGLTDGGMPMRPCRPYDDNISVTDNKDVGKNISITDIIYEDKVSYFWKWFGYKDKSYTQETTETIPNPNKRGPVTQNQRPDNDFAKTLEPDYPVKGMVEHGGAQNYHMNKYRNKGCKLRGYRQVLDRNYTDGRTSQFKQFNKAVRLDSLLVGPTTPVVRTLIEEDYQEAQPDLQGPGILSGDPNAKWFETMRRLAVSYQPLWATTPQTHVDAELGGIWPIMCGPNQTNVEAIGPLTQIHDTNTISVGMKEGFMSQSHVAQPVYRQFNEGFTDDGNPDRDPWTEEWKWPWEGEQNLFQFFSLDVDNDNRKIIETSLIPKGNSAVEPIQVFGNRFFSDVSADVFWSHQLSNFQKEIGSGQPQSATEGAYNCMVAYAKSLFLSASPQFNYAIWGPFGENNRIRNCSFKIGQIWGKRQMGLVFPINLWNGEILHFGWDFMFAKSVSDLHNLRSLITDDLQDAVNNTPLASALTEFKKMYNVPNFKLEDLEEMPWQDSVTFQNLCAWGVGDNLQIVDPNQDFSADRGSFARPAMTDMLLPIGQNHSFGLTAHEPKAHMYIKGNRMINGKFKRQEQRHIHLKIPLLSGVMGYLMPLDSYRLLPMAALKNVQLECWINPFAFFTSHEWMRREGWIINKFSLNVELIDFGPAVENATISQLRNGISYHTETFYRGPLKTFGERESPNETMQINMGFQSLKSIFFTFHPMDYLSNSYLRKQFRVSHNIQKVQATVGIQRYPERPLLGHGGNASLEYGCENMGDNTAFFIMLKKVFKKHLVWNSEMVVDKNNFAINGRKSSQYLVFEDQAPIGMFETQKKDEQTSTVPNWSNAYCRNGNIWKPMIDYAMLIHTHWGYKAQGNQTVTEQKLAESHTISGQFEEIKKRIFDDPLTNYKDDYTHIAISDGRLNGEQKFQTNPGFFFNDLTNTTARDAPTDVSQSDYPRDKQELALIWQRFVAMYNHIIDTNYQDANYNLAQTANEYVAPVPNIFDRSIPFKPNTSNLTSRYNAMVCGNCHFGRTLSYMKVEDRLLGNWTKVQEYDSNWDKQDLSKCNFSVRNSSWVDGFYIDFVKKYFDQLKALQYDKSDLTGNFMHNYTYDSETQTGYELAMPDLQFLCQAGKFRTPILLTMEDVIGLGSYDELYFQSVKKAYADPQHHHFQTLVMPQRNWQVEGTNSFGGYCVQPTFEEVMGQDYSQQSLRQVVQDGIVKDKVGYSTFYPDTRLGKFQPSSGRLGIVYKDHDIKQVMGAHDDVGLQLGPFSVLGENIMNHLQDNQHISTIDDKLGIQVQNYINFNTMPALGNKWEFSFKKYCYWRYKIPDCMIHTQPAFLLNDNKTNWNHPTQSAGNFRNRAAMVQVFFAIYGGYGPIAKFAQFGQIKTDVIEFVTNGAGAKQVLDLQKYNPYFWNWKQGDTTNPDDGEWVPPQEVLREQDTAWDLSAFDYAAPKGRTGLDGILIKSQDWEYMRLASCLQNNGWVEYCGLMKFDTRLRKATDVRGFDGAEGAQPPRLHIGRTDADGGGNGEFYVTLQTPNFTTSDPVAVSNIYQFPGRYILMMDSDAVAIPNCLATQSYDGYWVYDTPSGIEVWWDLIYRNLGAQNTTFSFYKKYGLNYGKNDGQGIAGFYTIVSGNTDKNCKIYPPNLVETSDTSWLGQATSVPTTQFMMGQSKGIDVNTAVRLKQCRRFFWTSYVRQMVATIQNASNWLGVGATGGWGTNKTLIQQNLVDPTFVHPPTSDTDDYIKAQFPGPDVTSVLKQLVAREFGDKGNTFNRYTVQHADDDMISPRVTQPQRLILRDTTMQGTNVQAFVPDGIPGTDQETLWVQSDTCNHGNDGPWMNCDFPKVNGYNVYLPSVHPVRYDKRFWTCVIDPKAPNVYVMKNNNEDTGIRSQSLNSLGKNIMTLEEMAQPLRFENSILQTHTHDVTDINGQVVESDKHAPQIVLRAMYTNLSKTTTQAPSHAGIKLALLKNPNFINIIPNPMLSDTFWDKLTQGSPVFQDDFGKKYPVVERMTQIPNVMLHENTFIGKAVYGIDFESIGMESQRMGGLNTIPTQPYNLTIQSDRKNPHLTKTEMHLFHYINILFKLSLGGIQDFGRA